MMAEEEADARPIVEARMRQQAIEERKRQERADKRRLWAAEHGDGQGQDAAG